MAIRAITKSNLSTTGDNGSSFSVSFGSTVRNAWASVAGFSFDHGNDDHHIQKIQASVDSVSHNGTDVSVSYTALMRDRSKNNANGSMSVLIIADVEA